MKHLIQEIKELFQRPRLLIQYLVLNFFLLSMGTAGVVYVHNEAVKRQQLKQSEKIIELSKGLDEVDLPRPVAKQLNTLQKEAVKVQEESVPKESGGSVNSQ